MNELTWFVVLTISSFTLLALEVFVPGGILGFLGAAALVGACGFAFAAFEPATAGFVSVILILVTTGGVFAWIVHLPKTKMGKRIALTGNLKDSKSTIDHEELVGQSGVAETDLRPSGYARINGKKLDVVAERGFVEEGTAINVIEVHGMRIVVAAAEESA